MTQRLPEVQYAQAIEAASARFYDVLQATPPTARVPTCPGWTAYDLACHLDEVHSFWQRIVEQEVIDEAGARAIDDPPVLSDYNEVLTRGRQRTATLVETLRKRPGTAPVWTWSSEQDVAFVARRLAHEATMHRLDAELTAVPCASGRTPIDATLAADGVDEVLHVMYGACPEWGRLTVLEGRGVRLLASDTGRTWLVSLARFTGVDPEGVAYDEMDLVVADTDPVDGTVRPTGIVTGTAEDLYCWLWHRPMILDLHRAGDTALCAEVERVVARSDL